MKIRFLGGRFQGRLVDLNPAGVNVGRALTNDLVLDEDGVSRQHCRISQVEGRWVIEDLKSTNGVRVNGERIAETRTLEPGDRIGIHQVLLLFTDGTDQVPPEQLAAVAEKPKDDAVPVLAPAAAAAPAAAGAEPGAAPADGESPDADELDDEEEDQGTGPRVPWLRVALLVIVLGVIGWLAYVMLNSAKRGGAEEGQAPAGAEGAGTAPAAAKPGTPTGNVSDDELAKLMASDDGKAAAKPAAGEGGEEAKPDEAKPAAPAGEAAAKPGEEPAKPGEAPAKPAEEVAKPAEEGKEGAVAAAAPGAPAAAGKEEAAPAEGAGGMVTSLIPVISTPLGATVVIDDQPRGETPLVLSNLASGRHKLALRMSGYEELVRQIYIPSALPTKPYEMRQRPGTVRITSKPPGAAVSHGTQLLGRTPLLLADMAEGQHDIRVVAAGFEPQTKSVTVSAVRGEGLQVDLVSILGAIEVVTVPPGCKVYVDEALKGVSVPAEGDARQSKPMHLDGFAEGEHTLKVEHASGSVKSGKVKVARGQATQQTVKLWAIDTKVVLNDGTVKYGMLAEKNAYGDIVLAESPTKLERYLNPQLAEVVALTPEQVQQVVTELRGGKDAGKKRTKEQPAEAKPAEGGGEKEPAKAEKEPAKAEKEPPKAEKEPAAEEGGELRFTSQELTEALLEGNATKLNRRFQNKKITITGVPGINGRDALGAFHAFGDKVRCFFALEVYDKIKGRIKTAQDDKKPVTVSGTVAGFRNNFLVVRDCTLVKEAPKEAAAEGEGGP